MSTDSGDPLIQFVPPADYLANKTKWDGWRKASLIAQHNLIRDLVYTLRSGVLAADAVAELTARAKALGCFP